MKWSLTNEKLDRMKEPQPWMFTASPQTLCCNSREHLEFKAGHATIFPRTTVLREGVWFLVGSIIFEDASVFK